jgi:hypothetical protein
MQDTSDSILAQDDTTFNLSTDQVEDEVETLIKDGSPEAKDKLIQLGKDRGIHVLPEMSLEEIQQQFRQAI